MFTQSKYLGRQIIGVLDYNRVVDQSENTLCYIYPRYVMNGSRFVEINAYEDFGSQGRFEVRLAGDIRSETFCREMGAVVSLRINSIQEMPYDLSHNIRLRYNRRLGREKSEVWVETLDSKFFYQIIDCDLNIKNVLEQRAIDHDFYIDNCYTNNIMLRCDGKLYGPFGFDGGDNEIKLYGTERFNYIIGEFNPESLRSLMLEIDDHSYNNNRLLCNLVPIMVISPFSCKTTFDMIDHRLLLNTFLDQAKQRFNYSREEARNIKDYCNNALNALDNMDITDERKHKLRELLPKIFSFNDLSDELIRFTISNNELRKELIEHILKDEDGSLEGKVSKSALYDIKQNLSRADGPHENKDSNQAAESNHAYATAVKGLKEQLQTAETQNSKLKAENELLKARVENAGEIKVLESRHEQLTKAISECENELKAKRKEIEERSKVKAELDKGCDTVLQRLHANIATLKDKADVAVKFIEAGIYAPPSQRGFTVSQSPVETERKDKEHALPVFDSSVLMDEKQIKDHHDIISMVSTYINDYGKRDLRDNDIANYLICITQGFITTFAGEPGTGKTSLCNLLSRALGLSREDDNNRFTEVSVERGWNSLRDLIGYYNPLSGSMEKSNAAVYDAFAILDAEARNSLFDGEQSNQQAAPYLVLLDEANLSPIEHYWSAFFRNCDFNTMSKRSISLGGNKDMLLPEQLRFLATVNFDHTTEELSARFLDRSWVITLEPADIEEDSNELINRAFTSSDSSNRPVVPFNALTRIFNPQKGDSLDEMIVQKWQAIQRIFASEKCSLPISPRNIKMVSSYCLAASRCMKCNTPGTKLAPLDYAVAQKILPTINGTGSRYENLIKELLAECTDQSMPICAKHLHRIERNGSADLGFYQFFSR